MNIDLLCNARRALLRDLKSVISERKLIFSTDWTDRYKPGEYTGDPAPNEEKQKYLESIREDIREFSPELLPLEVEEQLKHSVDVRLNELVAAERELRETIRALDECRGFLAYNYCISVANTLKSQIDEIKELGAPVESSTERRRQDMYLHALQLHEACVEWNHIREYFADSVLHLQKESAKRNGKNVTVEDLLKSAQESAKGLVDGDFWTVSEFISAQLATVDALPNDFGKETQDTRAFLRKMLASVTLFQNLFALFASEEPLPPEVEALM